MLTQERLKELLSYDPATGVFTWKKARGNKPAGSTAGTVNHGYLVTKCDKIGYLNHRLAWLYVHGSFPELEIDHINRDKADNRLCNLRLATTSQNQHNAAVRSDSTTGVKGVSLHRPSNKYRAAICVKGERTVLGYFTTIAEAAAAYAYAADRLHGDFARARRIDVDASEKLIEDTSILGF
ncbi:HNH endonuclease [Stutzerimonas kunmingensis]|uniref:HNH endonuclease n=1 Tax=Stutzerimonas kunmingensis TaxID=1211807 RepID=UPI00241E0E28|nr:HNH endonuclease [Stutzerimonas kunmingensis]